MPIGSSIACMRKRDRCSAYRILEAPRGEGVTEPLDARLACKVAGPADRTGFSPDRSVIEVRGQYGTAA